MITSMEVNNLPDLWHRLCCRIADKGIKVETRNGPAVRINGAVMITVRTPVERVLFDPRRNCNHVFHLMESIWMLAGRRDVAFVQQFNSNISSYSDDGAVFHAAYGYRWRNHFGVDQVDYAINALRADPNDRRVVISMWDANVDGNGVEGKDFPCNMMIIPSVCNGRLDFTIINRSNDLVWGLCGANAVHMTILQEFMATALGLPVGAWHHFTNNLHVYEPHMDLVRRVAASKSDASWAPYGGMPGYHAGAGKKPMVVDYKRFQRECEAICNGQQEGFEEPFLEDTVEPVWASWREWKAGNYDEAIEIALSIDAYDWRKGVVEWYRRALAKKGQ